MTILVFLEVPNSDLHIKNLIKYFPFKIFLTIFKPKNICTMKNRIALSLLVLSFYVSNAQITFQKRYAIGNTFDFLTSVVQNADRSYLMAGYDVNIAAYGIDLVKADSTGAVQWAKTYHSGNILLPYNDYYQLGKLIKTSDGGYIACGTRKSDFLIMKLDVNGNLTWSKNYNNGGTWHFLHSIKETSDGGYIAVGEIRQTSTDSLNAFILKITSNGTLSWGGTWNNNAFNADDVFNDVAEDPGNGYIAVGYTSQVFNGGADTTQDILAVKVATNGTFSWGYNLGDDGNDESANYIVKNGSNFYVTGYTSQSALGNDVFFMEMTGSGTQNFVKKYSYNLVNMGMKVLPLTNGNYSIIANDLSAFNILKLDVDATGNFLNGYSYSGNFSFPINVDGQKTLDGGWIMGTMANDYSYYLFKANSSGSTGCYESSNTPITSSTSFTQTSYNGAYATGASSGSPSITVTSFNISSTTTDCQFIPCDTPNVTISPVNPSICSGQSTTLTASGSNGSGSCTSYSWYSGQSTAAISVSPSSTSTYTVIGYVGTCASHPVSVTVTVKPTPTATITGDNSICVGESTTLTAGGGTTYLWSTTSTATSITDSPSTTTTYSVTATTNGCSNSTSYQVTVNSLPNASISGPNTSCAGNSITLTANGGDQFTWSTGGSSASVIVNPSSSTTYTVTVSNSATGCSATASQTVTVNPKPIISITGDTILCEGASTTLTASGADTYVWSTNETTSSITIVTPALGSTIYYVTATNSSTGCSTVRPITVQVVSAPNAQISGNNTICPGQSTTLTASGGTSYHWSTGSTNTSITVSPATDSTYYVTVSAGTCSSITSITIIVNTPPNASITGPSAICQGSTATLTASGGDAYLWNTTETTTDITVTPSTSTNYSVTVTDNTTQCTATASHPVTVNPNPVITFSGDTTICEGEATTITAGGGNQYTWNIGVNLNSITVSPHVGQNTYLVTVTNSATQCSSTSSVTVTVYQRPNASAGNDTSICIGSSAQLIASGGISYQWFPAATLNTSTVYNPLATPNDTTTYFVVATNSWGCKDTASVTVNVAKLNNYTLQTTSVSCPGGNDGTATISNVSGVLPFTYLWSNGQSGPQTNNLIAGTYTLTITDGLGCTYPVQATVTQPNALIGNTDVSNVLCHNGSNGSINLTVTGGTSPYTYLWSNGNLTANPTNLTTGTYSVTITDSHGCSSVISNIVVNQPTTALSLTEDSIKHASCFGSNDGLIIVHGHGGTSPYQYSWSNGTHANSVAFLTAGNYYVTVSDNNGCDLIDTIPINQPEAIVIHSNITDATCTDGTDGKIELVVTGGNPPYNYNWSNNTSSATIQNLSGGNYIVTITDNSNCTETNPFTVNAEQTECLIIPELITTNSDNINDKFEIRGIQYYTEVTIEIYNRWGDKVFSFSGSGAEYADPANQWDGSYKGKNDCTLCSFVYIVNVHNGKDPYQGVVTIKK
jgi:gliding motility-associated-like protein